MQTAASGHSSAATDPICRAMPRVSVRGTVTRKPRSTSPSTRAVTAARALLEVLFLPMIEELDRHGNRSFALFLLGVM